MQRKRASVCVCARAVRERLARGDERGGGNRTRGAGGMTARIGQRSWRKALQRKLRIPVSANHEGGIEGCIYTHPWTCVACPAA